MSNYTKTTNFTAKDSLASGNANKIVKGAEIDTEFTNIATHIATKADLASPTFTGTVNATNITLAGTITAANIAGNLAGTISGGTY
jgi:1,4-dihydroxy-2-naphthoyl-CoA synthase|tara:strand:- start:1512 stop:1769 length:258 start_codon:yes stop_codon:yes gene_type:complete